MPFAPAPNGSAHSLFREIVAGAPRFDSEIWDNVSPEATDLINKCLTVDPHLRITAEDALQHPWVSNASPIIQRRSSCGSTT
eukprot:scaffold651657_cov45-Prasinocladus_malaysianus.AAC.1